MKEITIKGYTFSELNEEAKAKALEEHCHILVEDADWHDPVLECFKEDMEAIGFSNVKPAYSGFWSQGDGACFTCQSVDLAKVFEHMKITNYFDIPQRWVDAATYGLLACSVIKNNSNYSHSNTITAIIEWDSLHLLTANDTENISVVLTDFARDCADGLYADLETAYTAETSADAVGTELEEREYLFTENGKHIKIK